MMETRNFCFEATILGRRKDLIVKAPVENGAVITNKFCPQELLTGGLSFITVVNGECIEEFIQDCRVQVLGIKGAGDTGSRLDAHIGGLMAAVMHHITRCGRLIFGDLLIYMDCFALLLEADGFSEAEIRQNYIRVCRTIVQLYGDHVLNTVNLAPLKDTPLYLILFTLPLN